MEERVLDGTRERAVSQLLVSPSLLPPSRGKPGPRSQHTHGQRLSSSSARQTHLQFVSLRTRRGRIRIPVPALLHTWQPNHTLFVTHHLLFAIPFCSYSETPAPSHGARYNLRNFFGRLPVTLRPFTQKQFCSRKRTSTEGLISLFASLYYTTIVAFRG